MTDKDQSVDLIGGVTTDEAIVKLLRDRCIAVEERGFDPERPKRVPFNMLPKEEQDGILHAYAEQHPELNALDVERGPKSVYELWDSIIKAVAPEHDPRRFHPTQLQEMRRMFYSGFAACLDIALMIGDTAVTEDQGVAYLQSLHDECHEFMQQMIAGEA